MLVTEQELTVSTAADLAKAAIPAACPLIAVVAPNSEALHDQVDDVPMRRRFGNGAHVWS